MTLQKIDRKRASIAGTVYAELRQAILFGRLKPGALVVEQQLAADLDISRTPLREALSALEQEGLIHSMPYRGTFVTRTTFSEVAQTMQVRERLEILAIELAIEAMPLEEIDRVTTLITESVPLLQQGGLEVHFECNRQFHSLAPRFSGNRVLEHMIDVLREKSHTYQLQKPMAQNTRAEIDAFTTEHLNVLEMYRRRDLDGAIRAMNYHLRATRERIEQSVPS